MPSVELWQEGFHSFAKAFVRHTSAGSRYQPAHHSEVPAAGLRLAGTKDRSNGKTRTHSTRISVSQTPLTNSLRWQSIGGNSKAIQITEPTDVLRSIHLIRHTLKP